MANPEREVAIVTLARHLYAYMEVEDPHEDKPWEALAESEREFYVGAIRYVLGWKESVNRAMVAAGKPGEDLVDKIARIISDHTDMYIVSAHTVALEIMKCRSMDLT
jgi:hypothetical protein